MLCAAILLISNLKRHLALVLRGVRNTIALSEQVARVEFWLLILTSEFKSRVCCHSSSHIKLLILIKCLLILRKKCSVHLVERIQKRVALRMYWRGIAQGIELHLRHVAVGVFLCRLLRHLRLLSNCYGVEEFIRTYSRFCKIFELVLIIMLERKLFWISSYI